jgi:hypothetical protein
MAVATRRLDLYLAGGAGAVDRAWQALEAGGFLRAGGRAMVEGGFVSAARCAGAETFLANGQGGFRVACPVSGENVVPAFNCACGADHDLRDLRYTPQATFAADWIHLVDVASADLTPAALAAVGPLIVVGRRG